jgi:UDP-glucuronate decarboxylase
LPQDDPKQRQPDISRAQKFLNWTPRVELAEGLGRTISYFKSEIDTEQTADSQRATAMS